MTNYYNSRKVYKSFVTYWWVRTIHPISIFELRLAGIQIRSFSAVKHSMLRCSRMPPLASPVLSAFRRCWIPAICIPHQLNLHCASIYAPFCSFASKSFIHGQHLRSRPMSVHHPSSKVTGELFLQIFHSLFVDLKFLFVVSFLCFVLFS